MKWLMTVSLMSLLYLLRVEGTDLLEERMKLQVNREMTKSRKNLIVKLLAGLLETDDNLLENGFAPLKPEEAEGTLFEERSVNAGIPRREQKTPCKLFFWKTFSHC
ncbi:somatostatin-1B-like isoform X1 [Scyliorhinus canicula]|uniref:Prepro-somatostatin d n=1 Tax=Scyliorhinus canicula TaxID=7830 RepID=A0A5C1ZVX2_SCYCA|nr:somatostatin-1B-like isoform X1 [Scyliorhinus canicula]XP_038677887.1 somatostatin-1B-like isoform X1 [Scyliorhinus canicula]QEO32904.1 prepro-somatostatin d [Scyliorhinus canicula]